VITILTATGARPEGLRLLASYINAQTWRGAIRWIIVDDCDPASTVPAMRDGIEVEIVRPAWRWLQGMNTQAACLSAGLAEIPAGALVVIAEDDDVYLPEHLQVMSDALRGASLVGQRVSFYYNIQTLRYRQIPGRIHASLGATAVRGTALQLLREVCARETTCIDMTLWREYSGARALLEGRTAVGIKGVPGRAGIGVGHRDTFGERDPRGDRLREWIGDLAPEYRWLRRPAA
jgi:hypothetical protein